MNIEKTGFCWDCGLPCADKFCSSRCEKACTRKQAMQDKIKTGKRANYGPTGV